MQPASPGLADLAGPAASRANRIQTWRRLWLDVHLYLGLFVGALLVVFGLTGSVLAFDNEFTRWINLPPQGEVQERRARPVHVGKLTGDEETCMTWDRLSCRDWGTVNMSQRVDRYLMVEGTTAKM